MSKFPIIKLTYQQGRFDTEAYRKKKNNQIGSQVELPTCPYTFTCVQVGSSTLAAEVKYFLSAYFLGSDCYSHILQKGHH